MSRKKRPFTFNPAPLPGCTCTTPQCKSHAFRLQRRSALSIFPFLFSLLSSHALSVNAEDLTVTIPRKENVTAEAEKPTAVWPLVEEALDAIEADDMTYDAARGALQRSDGCVVLATYLQSEVEHVPTADERFKVPLVVLAARHAEDDGGADAIYDPVEGTLYFETDEEDYAFEVRDDWTVDWPAVAEEEIESYPYAGGEHGPYALDRLMGYLDVGVEDYLIDDEDDEDEGPEHFSRI